MFAMVVIYGAPSGALFYHSASGSGLITGGNVSGGPKINAPFLFGIAPEDIVGIFSNYDIQTEIICASVRNPIHITDCALAGADIATVPYKVIEQMVHHPLTDAGIEKFQKDYKAVFGE